MVETRSSPNMFRTPRVNVVLPEPLSPATPIVKMYGDAAIVSLKFLGCIVRHRSHQGKIIRQAREISATLQACAIQPRGRKGASPSKISEMYPAPASRMWE